MTTLPEFFPQALQDKVWPYEQLPSGSGIFDIPATKEIPEVAALLSTCYEQLLDLTIVDRLHYGQSPWPTTQTSAQGFNRASAAHWEEILDKAFVAGRFEWRAILRSYTHNHVLIVQAPIPHHLDTPSVVPVWPAANWYEREAYDLFGIVFIDHPDLRRLLSDYGFVGHPLRKDYPMMGYDDIRYDGATGSCIFEPHGQQQRMSIPKVIREKQHELGEPHD